MIDFHCHLDLYPDPHNVARECAARGLYVLSVTTTPSAWSGTSRLAPNGSRIRTSLGLHPQLAHLRKSELGLFKELLPEARYVGEIGLDGAPDFKTHWNDQLTVFRSILLTCAAAGGRILSIHSRHAASPVLDLLSEISGAGTPVLHWFTGTQRELDRAVQLGCWFSVNPTMLRSSKGRALAARLPRDRTLTESDGPFAQVDGRAAMPWDAEQAHPMIADLWSLSQDELRKQLLSNLRCLAASTNGAISQ